MASSFDNNQPTECPNCGTMDTERVNRFSEKTQIMDTRICNNCPTQYDVMWQYVSKRNVMTMD